MERIATTLPEVFLLKPRLFGDSRGFFMETWNARMFADLGLDRAFVQDNQSRSRQGILRGLHYQLHHPQGKLVRVVMGAVFDVAVDLRRSSPHFGQWFGNVLSAENRLMQWIPPGFAHGFYVLSEEADFLYKTTDYYHPEDERSIRWDDPDLAVAWPLLEDRPAAPEAAVGLLSPLVSGKDAAAVWFRDAECYP